jgi:hypothetical protein
VISQATWLVLDLDLCSPHCYELPAPEPGKAFSAARMTKGVVMRISRLGALAALLVGGLGNGSTTTASAATTPLGTSITIGSAHLSLPASRLQVSVAVDVSCSSRVFTTVLFQTIGVSVEQSSGQGIAFGSGFAENPVLFPCDDATHSVNVTATADPSGGPFHGGPAIVTAFVFLVGTDEFGIINGDLVGEGPVTVRITGAEANAASPIA